MRTWRRLWAPCSSSWPWTTWVSVSPSPLRWEPLLLQSSPHVLAVIIWNRRNEGNLSRCYINWLVLWILDDCFFLVPDWCWISPCPTPCIIIDIYVLDKRKRLYIVQYLFVQNPPFLISFAQLLCPGSLWMDPFVPERLLAQWNGKFSGNFCVWLL